jgi:putative membrane protein
MIVWILLRWLVSAIAIWAAASWVAGIEVHGGFWTYLWLAVILGLVNAILGTILRLLTLPLTILTLGLFALVVNTAVLAATAGLSSKLSIDGFWPAFWAALVIAIVSTVLGLLLPDRRAAVAA